MSITDKALKAIKPKDKEYEIRDGNGEGFACRVYPSGTIVFMFYYHFDGVKRRMNLGKYPAKTLKIAKEDHRDALSELSNGIDPGRKKLLTNKESIEAHTVSSLAKEYIDRWAKVKKKSWKEDERILEKDVLPPWKGRKAKDITRRDVIKLLDKIVERGSPIAANRTLAVIRKMYNFAIGRDIVNDTPCRAINRPSKENQNSRVLTEGEIKIFWNTLPSTEMKKSSKLALKLQLVTIQRKGEIVNSEWTEFDLKGKWWTIPGTKTKNGLPHRVPLSPLAINILEELKALKEKKGESDFLFPSPRGNKPVTPDAIAKALHRNRDKFKECDDFTPHDLRRSGASHITGMGFPRLTVSKLLNHVESGITAVYDRHSYDNEKKLTLNAWSDKLNQILKDKDEDKKANDDNIFELRA